MLCIPEHIQVGDRSLCICLRVQKYTRTVWALVVLSDCSEGKTIPVRTIGEQHVQDDLGWIPTVKDWLCHIEVQPWMGKSPYQPMRDARSKELQGD